MNIDFGVVSKYFPERGFGFVRHAFPASRGPDVFFHIKNIQRTSPELAVKLDQRAAAEELYFWYDIEVTNKGEQVRGVLDADEVRSRAADSLPQLASKVDALWKDVSSPQPPWLQKVTSALLGERRARELCAERQALQNARRLAAEAERAGFEARRRAEEAERQKLMVEQRVLQDLEEREFEQLVAEMKPLGFRENRDVSLYIVRNHLGLKYQNISGIVRMAQNGDMWDFKGGFPPNIYARLCDALDLGNRGTRAQAVGFTAFRDLMK